MQKNYNPKDYEDRIYAEWMQNGYFHSEPDGSREPFCIVMPPPNITGQLHMGHALDNAVQDALTRYKRMQGFCTLWLPGTDHASIATEVKIIEQMADEGLTKADTGREKFLERAWSWAEKYRSRITEQLKKLGSSCDWQRERFTMDEGCNRAVREVFVSLYEKGLIYRGDRIINWCPECKTAISDAEVEYEEQASHLWHIKYPLADGNGYVVVATTRPETMLGDTAVAVNPGDERYKDFAGKMVMLPLMNRQIPVIADSYVDMEFGTGAVKITPAHDPNDYDMAQRHDIEILNIIDEDGTLNENVGAYAGLSVKEARKKVVEDLEALGLLVKCDDYAHNVGICYRCSTTIEPLISKQWFVSMQPLAEPAIDSVKNGDIRFVPDRFEKIYLNWMENIRDWCISRQLWWGHRIPAWYCPDCGEVIVARRDPDHCTKCGCRSLKQDEDVLDTWFSSALWPFSTLGWPDETKDLKYFYPTTVLVTAYDIIFFWVARMIFSGLEHMGEKPFSDVMIHGLIRDPQGRKMSKSLGNGVDPLEVIEEFGADALRYALATGNASGSDMRYMPAKVEAARNFSNKIWNASRFVIMNLDGRKPASIDDAHLDVTDQWILTRLNRIVEDATQKLDHYDIGLALQNIYDFTWNEFCDWYIEFSKSRLYDGSGAEKESVRSVLYHVLENILKLIHPFMPFITEEIYGFLPGTSGSIMVTSWPQFDQKHIYEEEAKAVDAIMDIIKAVRSARAEINVPASRKTRIVLRPKAELRKSIMAYSELIVKLASGLSAEFMEEGADVGQDMLSCICQSAEIYLPMKELVDLDKEIERLQKELKNAEAEVNRSKAMLSNQNFIGKAPAQVVEKEKDNLNAKEGVYAQIKARLEELQSSNG